MGLKAPSSHQVQLKLQCLLKKNTNQSTGWLRGEVGWYRGVRGLQGNSWQCAPIPDAEIKVFPIEVPVILSTPPSHVLPIKVAGV